MGKLKQIYERHELEILLALGAFGVYKFWGAFSAVGSVTDSVGAAVAGFTANVQEDSKRSQQRAAIKIIFPGATDSDLLTFESDATALASALGKLKGSWSNALVADRVTALGIAKKYSHYIQVNNVVQYHTIAGKRVRAERLLKFRLPVLFSFYSAVSGGNSLMSDLDGAMNLWNDEVKRLYNLYVK
jgi:hypothetical protein